jgi:hypothetical protein
MLLVVLAAAAPGVGGEGDKPSRPRLDLRATPPTAFSPARVQAIGRLVGGEDIDEFYCPAVEWNWGDGAVSARESDCPPFDGETKMARAFSADHHYRQPGDYSVRLTLRRAGRPVAVAAASISIRAPGEASPGDGWASVR